MDLMENQSTPPQPAALSELFGSEYLNGKALYLYLTGKIPSISFMNGIDPFDAIAAFRETYDADIKDWHNEAVWNHETGGFTMENTFFVMQNGVIIQFGHSFVHMIHSMEDWSYVETLAKLFAPFRAAGS
jgi:hypothetical protein